MAFRYSPKIVTDGLILYIDAANPQSYVSGSTDWNDLIGAADVTLLNGPTFSTDNAGCIVFDGVDDNSEFSNTVSITANSICAWVYNDDISRDATVVGNWASQYILYMDTDGSGDGYRVLYAVGGANKATSVDNINAIQDQWQYVVSTFSGTEVSLYVDGEHIETLSFSSNIMDASSNDWAIGADTPNGIRDWKGKISNVSIYNKALSATEVLQNYNAMKSRFGL
tara:strand:- start:195 stop:869 length:675 start_codon:yes stop_codon:yes gene_type:complete